MMTNILGGGWRGMQLSQERIVFAIAAILFVAFSIFLNNFLNTDNILSLIQNVSILGILGIGMALAIIGRGIDLSIVATMAMSVAWCLDLIGQGVDVPLALLIGLAIVVVIGFLNGVLIAYVEIPAIFATLAMGTVVYGFGQYFLVPTRYHLSRRIRRLAEADRRRQAVRRAEPGHRLRDRVPRHLSAAALHQARPLPLCAWATILMAARIAGIPTRPMTVLQYIYASVVGYVAGIVTATAVDSMNTRVANSTLVYDVILVVVIGGIGLSGGKGGVRNVIVGTLLIGILLNGMTIMDMPYTVQNIIKSLILLIAIIVDSHPQPARRADRATRGHLNDHKEHRPITGLTMGGNQNAIPQVHGTRTGRARRSATAPALVTADEYDEGQIKITRDALKGKKVAFVPLSMGFDLPQAWYEA